MTKPTQPKTAQGRFASTLTDEKVVEIRERYTYMLKLNTTVPATEWRSPNQIEHLIAREEGIAPATVHKIVLGLSYKGVGGPIDHARRAQRDKARRLRGQGLDQAAINAELKMTRTVSQTPVTTITLTYEDGHSESITVPASVAVTVSTGIPQGVVPTAPVLTDDATSAQLGNTPSPAQTEKI